jgi:hypothetical protein
MPTLVKAMTNGDWVAEQISEKSEELGEMKEQGKEAFLEIRPSKVLKIKILLQPIE